MSNEDLEQMNQLMVKQLKNRYNDPTAFKRFVIGVDREKMRLYDVENAAQSNIVDSGVDLDDNKLTDMSFKKLFDNNGNNTPDFSGIKV